MHHHTKQLVKKLQTLETIEAVALIDVLLLSYDCFEWLLRFAMK